MTGGFFYTVGYITAKVENLGNAANFKNPTNAFSKNLLEGSNLARKEFEQSKKDKVKKKLKSVLPKKTKPVKKKKKIVKKKVIKKKR
jgi:hypothetical protein